MYVRKSNLTDQPKYQNLINIVKHSYAYPFKNLKAQYYCFYCRANFTYPHDLREHASKHHPKYFESLLKEKFITKLDITRVDCRRCDAKVESIDELKDHLTSHGIAIHEAPDAFVQFRLTYPRIDCLECGENFLFIDELTKHLPTHFGTHVCGLCDAKFIQASSLEYHMVAHKTKSKRFPCTICGRSMCTNRARISHELRVHSEKPVIDCLKCHEKFGTYHQRNKHLVAVHGEKRSIPCPDCDRVFETRASFVSHNSVVHERQYKFLCEKCTKGFFNSTQLYKHSKRCKAKYSSKSKAMVDTVTLESGAAI